MHRSEFWGEGGGGTIEEGKSGAREEMRFTHAKEQIDKTIGGSSSSSGGDFEEKKWRRRRSNYRECAWNYELEITRKDKFIDKPRRRSKEGVQFEKVKEDRNWK